MLGRANREAIPIITTLVCFYFGLAIDHLSITQIQYSIDEKKLNQMQFFLTLIHSQTDTIKSIYMRGCYLITAYTRRSYNFESKKHSHISTVIGIRYNPTVILSSPCYYPDRYPKLFPAKYVHKVRVLYIYIKLVGKRADSTQEFVGNLPRGEIAEYMYLCTQYL